MKNIFKSLLALLCCGIAMVSCQEEMLSDAKIETDLTAISDVSAQNPADISVAVMSNTSWIVTYPQWVTSSANYGSGDAIVTFSFERNYKDETTSTRARSGEIKISGGGTLTGKGVTITIPVNQLGYTYVDPNPSLGGIPDAEEFVEFIKAANSGAPLTRWTDENGEVSLLADINLTGIQVDWQAIADATNVTNANNLCTIQEGCMPFNGKFNGNNHKITGFNPTVVLGANKSFGLFAVIEEATIRNVELEGTMTISGTNQSDAGMLVGTALNSTISDVKVNGKIVSAGTTAAKRFSLGGVCGYAGAKEDKGTLFKNCTSNVEAEIVGGSNTANGATCAMYGGIVGFSTTPNSATGHLFVTIENCVNNGNMNVTLGRCSGIVATANAGTILKDCTNNGNQVNKIANGRLGNVVCNVSNHCKLINCVNNGNIEATVTGYSGTVGGVFALMGAATASIEGGANYGTVTTLSTAGKYIGLIGANFSNLAYAKDIVVSGSIVVDGVARDINAGNYMEHIGATKEEHKALYTNITWSGAPAPEKPEVKVGINTVEDLIAFRDAVNAGSDLSKWQDENKVINLWADLDMSSVADWTPIGNGVFAGQAGDKTSSYTGAAFKGVFDGNNHILKNMKLKADIKGEGAIFGLFGIIDGATVKNLVMGSEIGDTGIFEVSSADGAAETGVITAVCFSSTVENCVNNIPVHCLGAKSTDNKRMTCGMVGFLYGTDEAGKASVLRKLINNAPVTAETGVNTKNGATSVQVGAIAGFANGLSKENPILVIECVNNGKMTSTTGRTSGIVASCNRGTRLEKCTNNGSQMNTYSASGGGRIGNVTCLLSANCSMADCVNNGDAVTSNAATHIGGLVALMNGKSEITGGGNYGKIIGDLATYHGTLVANINEPGKMDSVIAGGGYGKYNGGTYEMVTITAENYMKYIGSIKSGFEDKVTNIIFQAAQ